ncbi:MAG: hypothetical protein ACLFRB_06705 [Thiohalorhabdus sp.]|uniref:hypothetical protein n=1 Tax=Thiohalorhabdus sp. TaxID=3094134 RepID=UPI00397F7E83
MPARHFIKSRDIPGRVESRFYVLASALPASPEQASVLLSTRDASPFFMDITLQEARELSRALAELVDETEAWLAEAANTEETEG